MVFSSLLFLFRFLPVAFLAYYLAPKRLKNTVLLIASLVFYSWGEVRFFPVMIAVILVNYAAGRMIGRWKGNRPLCRAILTASLIFSVAWLVFFKYSNFIIMNLNAVAGLGIPYIEATKVLPLGISFYTFQIMTYTVDVYRGGVETERSLIDFGTFVVLFPQLIAGPIVKYSDINRELHDRKITLGAVQDGIELFILGLGSKVLLANSIGLLWNDVTTLGYGNISTGLAWIATVAFSLQIYFDFSGYSLMAIGMGKALGFSFPQNFNYPFIARSVTDFWRRWHMTLSGWFRDYVYIPLGGSRCGGLRSNLNLLIVWMLTGLWHGASWNYVLWGLYFAVLLMIERSKLRPFLDRHRVLSHLYTSGVVALSWPIFAIVDDPGGLGTFFRRLFSFTGGNDWMFYLRNYGVVLLLGILFSMPVLNGIRGRWPRVNRVLTIPFLGLVLVLSIAYLVDSTYNPFLYFRF